MSSIVLTWPQVLVLVVLVLSIYVLEMVLLWRAQRGFRHQLGRAQQEQQDRRLEQFEHEIASLQKRLLELETRLIEPSAPSSATMSPYNQAIVLAREGADVQRLAAECGISRGEAELIVALYRSGAT